MKPVLFPSSTWTEARDELESCLRYLLRRELAEWGADRFYIEITGTGGIDSVPFVAGFASHDFSQQFRSEIGHRFSGHCPGMFVDVSKLGALTDDTFGRFCEIVIHEAAHVVQQRFGERHFADVVEAKRQAKPKRKPKTNATRQAGRKAEKVGEGIFGPRVTNWVQQLPYHQDDFIRPLVHIGVRAEQAGWPIRPESLNPWYEYATGCFAVFELTLQPEIDQYRNRSLNGIWHHPAPDKFVTHWESRQPARLARMNDVFKELLLVQELEAKAALQPAT